MEVDVDTDVDVGVDNVVDTDVGTDVDVDPTCCFSSRTGWTSNKSLAKTYSIISKIITRQCSIYFRNVKRALHHKVHCWSAPH